MRMGKKACNQSGIMLFIQFSVIEIQLIVVRLTVIIHIL